MSVPRSVAEILREHGTLEVECIDRMYLNVYVPRLQSERGVVGFFRFHRGHAFASSALMDPISKAFIRALEAFAARERVPLLTFAPGQDKDTVMAEHRARFRGEEGVLFIGKAQEKTRVFRTEKRKNPTTGQRYPWIVRSTALVNHYYVYGVDRDFGPFFLKFCSYFPYTAKLCLNGHEYVKRQLAQRGIAFEALDNGILACATPRRLQALCDGLSVAKIDAFLRKWLHRLPAPFTAADHQAGYRYDCSILQAEFSLTQVLDQPRTGRLFFEAVIRENLDIGRPDQVQTDLRAPGDASDARAVPHARAHRRGDPLAPPRLQAHPDQAVPQGGSGPPDRDHDQRRPGLRPRQAAGEPRRPAAGRLPGQPTPPRRPTTQPRLCPRRSHSANGPAPAGGRRSAGPGLALR